MAMSSEQAVRMQDAHSQRVAQDKKNPFLINIEDGRLIPNVSTLAKNSRYRVYTGDPKASDKERMKFLDSNFAGNSARTAKQEAGEAEPFDIGHANKDDLIAFAAQEFGLELSHDVDVRQLRKQVAQAAKDADASKEG